MDLFKCFCTQQNLKPAILSLKFKKTQLEMRSEISDNGENSEKSETSDLFLIGSF